MKAYTLTLTLLTSVVLSFAQTNFSFEVIRLNNGNPIISEVEFAQAGAPTSEGENINGPSMIRIPDWIASSERAHPTAKYYVYFGHHSDDYVRMAWASNIEGPYHLYQSGTGVAIGDRGVLDHGGNFVDLDNNISIENNHLSSPDVHVDNVNNRIIMYFHAGSSTFVNGVELNSQLSYVSTSANGLEFYDNIEPVILGSSYFRVFEYDGELYALDNGGKLNKAPSISNPWLPPSGFDFTNKLWELSPNRGFQDDIALFEGLTSNELRVRHTAVRVNGDVLEVYYSRRGEKNERIQMSSIYMSASDWHNWNPTYPPAEIMAANPGWEGGQYALANSESSSAPPGVNQLRDPYVFEDTDGELYLLYTGEGEDGIGLAHLYDKPTPNTTLTPTKDAYVRGGTSGNINYGSDDELWSKSTDNDDFKRKAYINFDLSGVNSLTHAVVRLYCKSASERPVSIYETDDSWTEGAINWNNAPVAGEAITTTQIVSSNQYYEWNVTEYAQSKVGSHMSLVIDIASLGDTKIIKFDSREGVNAPQLELVTAAATSPNGPTSLSAVATDTDKIVVSWSDNAYNETGFRVQRKTGSGSFAQIALLDANTTYYDDSNLSDATEYTYRVRAINATGNSTYSNQSSATTFYDGIVTYNPDEDAYIRGGIYSAGNYGSETKLVVKQGNKENFYRKSLLKFDLNGEPLGELSQATLRLYATKVNPVNLTIYGIADDWVENTVSWDNTPAESANIDNVSLTAEDVYYEWDVTAYVANQLTGDRVVSFGLWDLGVSNQTIEFNSKEASNYKPELVISSTSAGARIANEEVEARSITESVSIYPNPLNQSSLSIDLPEYEGDGIVRILDIKGKNVYQQYFRNASTIEMEIGFSLPAGIYLIDIKADGLNKQSKLIIY